MQSRLDSWLEVLSNVASGYITAIIVQILIYPLYGIHLHIGQQATLAGIFIGISLLRSYFIRRFWNKRLTKRLKEKKKKVLDSGNIIHYNQIKRKDNG